MDMNEYIEWYEDHYGMPPSQRLIEKFKSINQPVKEETEDNEDKKKS